jgi:phenylacetate-CoA ligase
MDIIQEVREDLQNLLGLSPPDFLALQEKRFLKYLEEMYKNSDFYRKHLEKNGIYSEEDLPKSISQINKLPILNKDFFVRWTASNETLDNIKCTMHTSGTTQKPMKVDYTLESIRQGWGFLGIRAFLLMGIDLEEKGMMLTSIDKKTRDSHSSHINTLALKEILGDKLIDQPIIEPLDESLDKITMEKIKWIGTVPAFYNASVFRSKERKIDMKKMGIKTLFFGGVDFPKNQKKIVRDYYNSEILGFYVLTELCTAGTQVSKKCNLIKMSNPNHYILFSDQIIFEFLDDEGKPVKKNERGRVIATPLFMDGMPLIRYEVGDDALFHGYKNNFPVISDIRRRSAVSFGHGVLNHYEVESIKESLITKTGISVSGFQVAKKNGKKGIDLPILRIETNGPLSSEEEKLLKNLSTELFMKNEQMKALIEFGPDNGGIHKPLVEFYEYGKLVGEGIFKPKLISDETK